MGITPALSNKNLFDFFDFAVKKLAAGVRGRDAAVSIAIRQRRINGVCLRQTPMPKSGRPAGMPAVVIYEFLLRKKSKL
jgi:hypothetical protein